MDNLWNQYQFTKCFFDDENAALMYFANNISYKKVAKRVPHKYHKEYLRQFNDICYKYQKTPIECLREVLDILDISKPNTQILDLNAETGEFLIYLRRISKKLGLFGVENEPILSLLRTRLTINNIFASVYDSIDKIKDIQFDYIIIKGRPKIENKDIKARLKPRGKVIIILCGNDEEFVCNAFTISYNMHIIANGKSYRLLVAA